MKKYILSIFVIALIASCKQEKSYDATGIFEATTITVASETSGKILSMPFSEGDTVYVGQQIAQIDTISLYYQMRQATSQQDATHNSLPNISAQAAALRSQIAHAQKEMERQGRLLDAGATTRKNYDDASSQVRTLQAQLQGLLSTLETSSSSINSNSSAAEYHSQQIADQISKCTINSPISGSILLKYAEPGEFATPGRPLYKLANLNQIYLRCYFTANQLASIKIGQKVTVVADFGGEKQYNYPGEICWISEESEFTPKSIQTKDSRANLVYAAKVRVNNDGRLKIGQYGEVIL